MRKHTFLGVLIMFASQNANSKLSYFSNFFFFFCLFIFTNYSLLLLCLFLLPLFFNLFFSLSLSFTTFLFSISSRYLPPSFSVCLIFLCLHLSLSTFYLNFYRLSFFSPLLDLSHLYCLPQRPLLGLDFFLSNRHTLSIYLSIYLSIFSFFLS
ncbi:unnamed protein product [Acanthosepion pharaonis]|uniref:Uncharacterized protein n=1 Tax=Acanthosepion pharaonis TaxID=158019 RepID=A0A812CB12_ACAPH|nr:unnamed protein product [Sepia pharaonis]